MASGLRRELRRAYGLDEAALVPGVVTVNLDKGDPFAEVLESGSLEATALTQGICRHHVCPDLTGDRIQAIKQDEGVVAASSIQQSAATLGSPMENIHPGLPRGTRLRIGINGSLQQTLFGLSASADGTQDLRWCS